MRKVFGCLCIGFLLLTASGFVNAAGQEDPLAAWRETLKKSQEDAALNPPKPAIVYEPEEEPDPAYLEAIKSSEKKEAEARSRGEVKPIDKVIQKQEPVKEMLCLENKTCRPADFSSGSLASSFVEHCKSYINEERVRGHKDYALSQRAYACYAFLLSAIEMISLQDFIKAKDAGDIYTFSEVKNIKVDTTNCPSMAVAETYPVLYVDFMKRNPDLLKKNIFYSIHLFYQDLFGCVSYTGTVKKGEK